MLDNKIVEAALRELDDATNPKADTKTPKPGETDWKALSSRDFQAQLRNQFGVQ